MIKLFIFIMFLEVYLIELNDNVNENFYGKKDALKNNLKIFQTGKNSSVFCGATQLQLLVCSGRKLIDTKHCILRFIHTKAAFYLRF